MNESANPYAAPEADSQQPGFQSVLVPSAITFAIAIACALILDFDEFTLGMFEKNAPTNIKPLRGIFAVPVILSAIAPYFWTARKLSLPDGTHRSVGRASLIAIFAPIIAAGCITVAGYSNQLAKGFVSTVLPEVFADHHIVRTLRTMIVIGIIYSILYSTIHKIIFRRSRWMMLLQILFPAISILILCVFGPAWVKPASAKAFCTFITIFIGYIAHANCIAWWIAEHSDNLQR